MAMPPDTVLPAEQHFLLSSLSPGPAQKRVAVAVVLGLLIVTYLITGPLADIHLVAIPAFVAIYATAMCVTAAITGILLYAHFSILRSRAILIIASGYLFSALIIIPYTLAFPGVLAPDGLIGGLNAAAGLYVLWHCGFLLFVLGYALSKDNDSKQRWQGNVRSAILWSVGLTTALAAAGTLFCIWAETLLPSIMLDPAHFSAHWPHFVGAPVGSVCTVALVVCIAALVTLWIRRRSALDLWLMVIMCLYLIEVLLSFQSLPVRFSSGWYAVRLIGFFSSSIILIVLLYEITKLYGKLFGAMAGQRREREARIMTGDAVAASIAHELRQPLTAMVTTADAGLRFLDRLNPSLDKAKEAFKRIAEDGHRAGVLVGNIRANFKSDIREKTSCSLNDLIHDALGIARGDLQKHGIIVRFELSTYLPYICGNPIQLQQVLVNLIMNSVDALTSKNGPRILTIKSDAHNGSGVMVSIEDTGTGIKSDDVSRIFNPLFTTKSDGMGMGLAICRAIIEAHGGQLWYAPSPSGGAVFQFSLHAA